VAIYSVYRVKAIIYVRQSKDRDGEGAAVERQLETCRQRAVDNDFVVVEEIVENDVSATRGARPGFERLLKRLEAGDAGAIVVWHTDRLYRRMRDLLRLLEVAEEHDVAIVTVRGGDLDLGTASGRMFANMTASVARYEVEHKSERQVAANEQRATRGHWQFSRRPYGYRRRTAAELEDLRGLGVASPSTVVIVEEEAAEIRDAYRRYLDGESYYAIAQSLNERAVPTTDGMGWTIGTLKARLANPGYAGILTYRGKVVGDGDWEPIIDRQTWNSYLAARSQRKIKHTWSNQGRHLLSGLLVCGVCGGRMFARPVYRQRGGERITTHAYACRENWCVHRDLTRVDEVVERAIVARLSLPDAVEALRVDDGTESLESEAREVRARWDSLASLVASGDLRPDAVRAQTAPLRERLERIEAEIAGARERSVMTDIALADDVAQRWDELSLPKRRMLIDALMTVTIHLQANPRRFDLESVEITWRTGAGEREVKS
jgi:site-specific DNA recombinase